MPTTIRKALILEFGDVSNINIVEAQIADPLPNEVQVEVIYSGFSGSDINMRLGQYPMQRKTPLTPGYCMVGRVKTNGSSSRKFKVNSLVVAVTVYDAEAELVNVPEKYLYQVPDGLDLQQATALIMDWSTAYSMVVDVAKVHSGQCVFIHCMSGAIGHATMMLCLLRGATVYGTASARNHEALKALGATPFVYTDKNWIAAMQKLGGVHAVFDPLGFKSWEESYSICSSSGDGGVLIGFGGNSATLSGKPAGSVVGPTAKLYARGFKFWSKKRTSFYYITRDDKTFTPNLQALFKLCAEGKIQPLIKSVHALDDIKGAHLNWGKAPGMGSMLIKVSSEDQVDGTSVPNSRTLSH